ncbi:hypothetical protein B0H10DRAFT_2200453 [Mycena sp. CBHHK59/15]|nr:hypothetical protein B0H10DRAFT_2200453 [Mycena sp. CBHHK59/15]
MLAHSIPTRTETACGLPKIQYCNVIPPMLITERSGSEDRRMSSSESEFRASFAGQTVVAFHFYVLQQPFSRRLIAAVLGVKWTMNGRHNQDIKLERVKNKASTMYSRNLEAETAVDSKMDDFHDFHGMCVTKAGREKTRGLHGDNRQTDTRCDEEERSFQVIRHGMGGLETSNPWNDLHFYADHQLHVRKPVDPSLRRAGLSNSRQE